MNEAAAADWRRGGCHCGRVSFEVRVKDSTRLLDCNCSICRQQGFLHLIVTAADFRLLSGADDLQDYRFGSGTARHLFCRHCGTKSFYVPRSHPDGYSVNARCLAVGPDPAWPVEAYDGQNWETARAGLK